MSSNLVRELGAFPFRKVNPSTFRMELAGLSSKELDTQPIKTWISTSDLNKVLKIAGSAKIIRHFPHIQYVIMELTGRQIALLDELDVVACVWADLEVKAEHPVVDRSNPSAVTVAPRSYR